MPDTADSAAILLAAAQQGPGDTLRVVLLVSLVGGVLLAWFLLRGYRGGGADTTGDPNGATPGEPVGAARTAATEPPAAGQTTAPGSAAGVDGNAERDADA